MKKLILFLFLIFNFSYSEDTSNGFEDFEQPSCGISTSYDKAYFSHMSDLNLYSYDKLKNVYVLFSEKDNSKRYIWYKFYRKTGHFITEKLPLNTLLRDVNGLLHFGVGFTKSKDNRCEGFYIFNSVVYQPVSSVSCQKDEEFDFETKQCIKCPASHWYSFQMKECTKICEFIENQKDRFDCTCSNAKLGKFEGYANLQMGGITNVTYVSKKDGKTYRTSTHNCALECQAGSIGIPVDENFVNGANYDYCFVSNSPPIPPIDNNSTDPYNPEQPKPKPYVNPSSTVKMEYGGDGVLRPKLTDKGSIEYNKEKSPTENKTETKTESEVTPVKDEKGNIIKYDISTKTSGNNYTSNLDLIAELLGHIEKNTRPYDDHNNSGGGGGNKDGGKIDKDKFKTENSDAIAKLDKMQSDSVGFLSKVESEFEKVKSSLNNMMSVLKNPLSSPRSHKITTCPYKDSFTIESRIIDLEFDFCKIIQPISGIFYIFFFLSFTIMFTVFLYKFITKVLL